jgi:hypothetical protein
MSSSRYVTPTALAELHDRMLPDEWAVMHDVATMRLATTLQLQQLNALRSSVHVRSFRRLLQRLHEHQLLFRLERTIGGRRAGSAGYVWGVGLAGQRLLGDQSPRRPWTPRPSWLAHALASSELYVKLRSLEARQRLAIDTFEPEPACWRSYSGPGGGMVDLKPDAFVRLAVGKYLDSYFVEIDCGTESPATLARKAAVYADYLDSGVEQAKRGVFPKVLWLAPTRARVAVIQRAIDRETATSELHVITTQDKALGVLLSDPP